MCLVRGRHDTVSLEALKYPENQSKLRQGQHALTSVLLTLFWQKRERFEALQRYNTFLWSQSNLKTSRISFFSSDFNYAERKSSQNDSQIFLNYYSCNDIRLSILPTAMIDHMNSENSSSARHRGLQANT